MSTRSEKYVPTPEDQIKGERRRAKRELKLKTDRVRPVAASLDRYRNSGVVALKGAVLGDFFIGIDNIFGKDKVMYREAPDTIQAKTHTGGISEEDEFNWYQQIATDISEHRRKHGDAGLIVFKTVRFDIAANIKPNLATNRLLEVISQHDPNGPMVLLTGHGSPDILPTAPRPDRMSRNGEQMDLVGALNMVWALKPNGELSTDLDPSYYDQDAFASYLPQDPHISAAELAGLPEPETDPYNQA